MRETAVVAVRFLAGWQFLGQNGAVPRSLRPPRVLFLEDATTYLQLFQGWGCLLPRHPKKISRLSLMP